LSAGLQKFELPFDSLQGFLAEAWFFFRLLLFLKAGVALGLVGKVAEATDSEAGKGVEGAQEIERVLAFIFGKF